MRKLWVTLLLLCVASAGAGSAFAQSAYPTRPVRIVVPYAAGGVMDLMARLLAVNLNEAWGQQVFVENRPGGGTNIGAETVQHAAPDGHTLFVASTANTVNMSLYRRPSYNIAKDFAPVSLLITMPNVLVVHPSVPAKSIKELIALAKTKPGQLSYASTGTASSAHLSGELFKMMAEIDVLHVPYKGGSTALNALLAGDVSMAFVTVSSALPHIKAGKIRGLAVTSDRRSAAAPDLPTIAESSLAGYEMSPWQGLVAPAATPPGIVNKLHADVTRAILQANVRDKLALQGVEVTTNTPAEFAKFIEADVQKNARVVQRLEIKLD